MTAAAAVVDPRAAQTTERGEHVVASKRALAERVTDLLRAGDAYLRGQPVGIAALRDAIDAVAPDLDALDVAAFMVGDFHVQCLAGAADGAARDRFMVLEPDQGERLRARYGFDERGSDDLQTRAERDCMAPANGCACRYCLAAGNPEPPPPDAVPPAWTAAVLDVLALLLRPAGPWCDEVTARAAVRRAVSGRDDVAADEAWSALLVLGLLERSDAGLWRIDRAGVPGS